VARDRQRAKERRRQRQHGAADGTPAPDPLKHASAEVDQARLAEAGAVRGGSGDAEAEPYDDGLNDPANRANPDRPAALRAPDAVEGDQPIRRADLDPSVAEDTAPATQGKPRGRLIAFLGHCIDELRRVRWPDRRQVGQATAVVLGFVVIAGGYLGLMDAIWKPLIQAIL
jgi:preprotein translocase SecE subunit